jgi:DNA-binding MurR/RpiR family transcriptional regulator
VAKNNIGAAGTLESRILAILPKLTPKQRSLARVLLSSPHSIAFSSAQSLGKQAGVDGATVVRFCRLLGYQGLNDIKIRLAAEMPRVMTAAEKIQQEMRGANREIAVDEHPADHIYRQDIANIEKARALNSPGEIEKAAGLLNDAGAVLILAGGLTAGLAATFGYMLRMIGIRTIVPSSDVGGMLEIAQLQKNDAVVAIAFRRYVAWPIRLFQLAGQRTRRTLAISDSVASPVAKFAKVSLIAPTEAREVSNSFVAPMSILNVLTTNLLLRHPQAALKQLTTLDDLYRKGKATLDD